VLANLKIEYGIAGSFASTQYGEPRQTRNVDLTLHLQPVDVDRFAAAFDALQMAADAYAIRETYTYTAPLPFGVIDTRTAGKRIAISCGTRLMIMRRFPGVWNGRLPKRNGVQFGCMRRKT
jgi:hypothetical protein